MVALSRRGFEGTNSPSSNPIWRLSTKKVSQTLARTNQHPQPRQPLAQLSLLAIVLQRQRQRLAAPQHPLKQGVIVLDRKSVV